ncbi:hypothetical protein [Bacillus coahuilensis]|nr:hypothetical protein [Bacillus coahuilensis]
MLTRKRTFKIEKWIKEGRGSEYEVKGTGTLSSTLAHLTNLGSD